MKKIGIQFKKWVSFSYKVKPSKLNSVSSSHDENEGKKIKTLFVIYFDGCYGSDKDPNLPTTFQMGVCLLLYKDNKLHVYLRQPGLLIGKGGETIDNLSKCLGCEVIIYEYDILTDVVI